MVHRSLRAIRACLTLAAIAAPPVSVAAQHPAATVAQSPVVAASAASPQPGAQAPTVVSVKPPIFNRANERLPSWLRLRGEFRERMEGADGIGFNDSREDLYWLSRVRLNATITPSKSLSFQA